MARQRFATENGYIKEKITLYANMTNEQYECMQSIGVTAYFNLLLKNDAEKKGFTLDMNSLTNDVRQKFLNDPRRTYLLQQLITEFYCNINSNNVLNTYNCNINNNQVATELSVDRDVDNMNSSKSIDEIVVNEEVKELIAEKKMEIIEDKKVEPKQEIKLDTKTEQVEKLEKEVEKEVELEVETQEVNVSISQPKTANKVSGVNALRGMKMKPKTRK